MEIDRLSAMRRVDYVLLTEKPFVFECFTMTSPFELRNQLDQEFDKESDRGCAILTLCLLEESLVKLIGSLLPGGDKDARHFLPKGRLAMGVANAHKLGLLDDRSFTTFKQLAEIRNIFAHGILEGITFQTDAIREKVSKLPLPDMGTVPEEFAEIRANPRRHFQMAVDNLFFTLDWVTGNVARMTKQHVPTWKVEKHKPA